MRLRRAFMCAGFLFAFSGFACAQTTTEFPIVDRSEVTGVLQFSGSVTSVEQFVANQLESSCGAKAKAKNVSGKPILLVIASLDVRAPFGGCNVHHVYQTENFFNRDTIAPDADITFEDSNPGAGKYESGPANPLSPPEHPTADARLLFVQYADGSNAGDLSAAKTILQTRKTLWERIHALLDAYGSGGESALDKAMEEKVDDSDAQWQVTRLRELKQSKGLAAVIGRMKFMLQSAESHKAALEPAQN